MRRIQEGDLVVDRVTGVVLLVVRREGPMLLVVHRGSPKDGPRHLTSVNAVTLFV